MMTRALREVTASLMHARQPSVVASPAEPIREIESLKAIRKWAGKSQVLIAQALGITQPAVAQLEKRSDIYLSTLRDYVEAVGGKLELVVEFPGAVPVRLTALAEARPQGEKTTPVEMAAPVEKALETSIAPEVEIPTPARGGPVQAIGAQLLANVGEDVTRWCELIDYWGNFDAEWQGAAVSQMETFVSTIKDPNDAETLLNKLSLFMQQQSFVETEAAPPSGNILPLDRMMDRLRAPAA